MNKWADWAATLVGCLLGSLALDVAEILGWLS